MIRYDVVQGSAEWRMTRLGKPTASEFHRILTPTGKRSEQAHDYRDSLLAELVLGRPLDAESYPWMRRGHELEERAAQWYELQADVTTEVVGFCTTDDGLIGASPDRLVGDDGLLELKCPAPHTHIGYLLYPKRGVDAKYKVQALGQLYVTGRAWNDVVSFHPDMPNVIVRVERDEPFISLLNEALREFCAKLAEGHAELESRGLLNVSEKEPPPFDELVDQYFSSGSRRFSSMSRD